MPTDSESGGEHLMGFSRDIGGHRIVTAAFPRASANETYGTVNYLAKENESVRGLVRVSFLLTFAICCAIEVDL